MQKSSNENTINLSRRNFMKMSGAAGVGITFGLNLTGCSSQSSQIESSSSEKFTNAWVHIPPVGKVTFTCPRSEMGQATSTGLAMLLCEAMDYPLEELIVLNAPANKVYNHKQYRSQATGGSSSISTEWESILNMGASIRATFLEAAGKKLKVNSRILKTSRGKVVYKEKKLSYQNLTTALAQQEVVVVKHKLNLKKSKIIGKKVSRVDNLDKVMGKEQYGIDGGIENSLMAVMIPFPEFGSTPKSCNQEELLALPGIQHVLKISTGFTIVADKYWQALKAKEEFKGTWNRPAKLFNSQQMLNQCRETTKDFKGKSILSEGDDYKKLEHEIEAQYSVPYLAHATLEPQNANVWVKENEVEVWLPTQSPGGVKPMVGEITGIPQGRIHVKCSSLGGGFGRRGELDALRNCTEISHQIKKPVKLIYDREDDTRYGFYRPLAFSTLKASFDQEGKQIFWKQSIATQSIAEELMPKLLASSTPEWMGYGAPKALAKVTLMFADGMTVKEGILAPYQLSGAEVIWQKIKSPVSTLFWRSVGHTQNAFFAESFVDEIAHKLSLDPMRFREDRLANHPRQLKVLQKVKEMSGWENDHSHKGVAVHFSFKSYAAAVVELEEGESLKVKNVWVAIDCGMAINPDGVHAQLMSSVIFGLTAAMFGKIDIEEGRAVQGNFDDYPLLTMAQTPHIKTAIIDSTESPTGAGEPGVPVMAPALCNAIFQSKKKRIRELPVTDHMDIS